MQRRFIIPVLVIAVVGAAVVAIAQSPTTPTTPPPAVIIPPADPTLPGPRTVPPISSEQLPATSPLARFDPLVAQPHQTQAAVRAVLLGGGWMTRMNQAHGRFMYGYNPALREPLQGDHDLKQARGALAMAQCARFTGDEKHAAIASQGILALLAATKMDPLDPNCRVPVQTSMFCNRVGFAALVALAIYELPAPDAKLVAEAERLCAFLRKHCRPDGSVHYTDGPSDDPMKLDPAGMNEYPGEALQAIVVGNRIQPAPWKLEVASKGLAHYRVKFKSNPHPMLAATLTPAFAELYRQNKSNDVAQAIFEMNDWLCGLQIAPSDAQSPQWAGGFRALKDGQLVAAPPGYEVGHYLESIACAYEINRLVPDLARDGRYKSATLDATQFICGLQYVESNTRHFENSYRANLLIGGFHLSPTDGNLRIDATATAVAGLIRFLSSGAEK
jgi:hypothetical protein